MPAHRRTAVLTCVLLAFMAGLADAANGKVSGAVTLDGKPVSEAKISFHREDGQFFGSKIKDGNFSLDVLPVGKYVVVFQGGRIPEKYGSEEKSSLRVDMREGEAVFDFDLQH